MGSRGISPVIATVLLILVAVSATALIAYWALATVTSVSDDSGDLVERIISDLNGPEEFVLSLSVEGEGSVIIDPDKAAYAYGETVTITAEPEEFWYIYGWVVDGNIIEFWDPAFTNPIEIIMTENKSISAVFEMMVG